MKETKGTVVLEERRAPLVARVLGIAVVLVMGGVLVVWGVDLGKRIVGASHGQALPDVQQQLEDAQAEIARLTAERDALQAVLKAAGVAPPAAAGAVSASAVAVAPPGAPAVSASTAASGTITALPAK
ncbi:hypothetical protein GJ700_15990 [Duganella sp. FT92W]|uniref:Uncharacterized protein n=1 Tax=Pseudoduganella rivuli TaxID=2666085 RepID=A0A7X2IND9_9BURK|nr:hypothetical protein [Pseudoduganella rivuli]MRV73212.1 hypothetical protein [Pseudoduganella rivuli]